MRRVCPGDQQVKTRLEGATMTCRLSTKSFWWTLFRLLYCAALSLVLTGGIAQAQIATASLNGTVTDPSGALIPGASVSLKNVATNVERTTTTNSAGQYVL